VNGTPISLMHPTISLSGCLSQYVRRPDEGISYQAHERIGIFLLLFPPILLLRDNRHSGVVRHCCLCEEFASKIGVK
jgi:hypothetical protein